MSELVGYTLGESTITRAEFIAVGRPRVGQYVVMRYEGVEVLGVIQRLTRGSAALPPDISDAEVVERIARMEGGLTQYMKGSIKILGDVERLTVPRIPPPPATEVRKADSRILARIFGDNGRGVRIGVLAADPEVPVYLDANKMVTRHLAILAVTGAGKSNTVAVITDGLLALGGTVIIFDMHSEYVDTEFRNGKTHLMLAKVNPFHLHPGELMHLLNIEPRAHIQERYFRKAYRHAKKVVGEGKAPPDKFLDLMVKHLEKLREDEDVPSREKQSIDGVLNKIEDFREKYSEIIDPCAPPIAEQIRPGCANIADLGHFDEEAVDVFVSHALRSVLVSRKRYVTEGEGLPVPVFLVLEEAHILAPSDRPTLSKYWIGRIAREGRKFGVGLCLVSQRPKALDVNALSQANNMIVLRLVEPSDQRYVQQASEVLSEDLLEQLPALNVGEAVVLGQMVRVPAIVRVDLFEGKRGGGDIDVVGIWRSVNARSSSEVLDSLTEEW